MSVFAARWRLALAAAFSGFAAALVISAHAEIPLNERRSSYEDMSRDNKAMQDDDTANPAMLTVLDGEALWHTKMGSADKSCADCHGDAKERMKGVAAQFPKFDARTNQPLNLEQRINMCHTGLQRATPFAYEGKEMLALATYIELQSRGEPIAPPDDPRLTPYREQGRELYNQRIGQLNLACVHCHDDNWGKSLAGNKIPQAHPTGYPIYRLEWQSVGSLQRRLRNCMIGMRAEPYPYGAPELVAMELYLMWRARGMKVEAPAVRP
jgi:L-cysteine S-thiosulfotransferase